MQTGIRIVLLPEELTSDKMGVTEETIETVLEEKYQQEKNSLLYVGGVRQTPIFIPVDIMEDVVE